MFKLAMDHLPGNAELSSRPIISHVENLSHIRALLRVGQALVDHCCESFRQVSHRIVLDINHTFDVLHDSR